MAPSTTFRTIQRQCVLFIACPFGRAFGCWWEIPQPHCPYQTSGERASSPAQRTFAAMQPVCMAACRRTVCCDHDLVPTLFSARRTVESVVRSDGGRNGGFDYPINGMMSIGFAVRPSPSTFSLSCAAWLQLRLDQTRRAIHDSISSGSFRFHLFLPKEAAVGASAAVGPPHGTVSLDGQSAM